MLGIESTTYFKGWHIGAPDLQLDHLYVVAHGFTMKDAFDLLYSKWALIRVVYLAPPLQFLANACIVLFLIQILDRLILCLCCLWIKIRRIKSVPKQVIMDLESGDGNGYYLMILIQIPMCNEKKNVGRGPYLCPKHTKCHSCGSTVPGNGLSVSFTFGKSIGEWVDYNQQTDALEMSLNMTWSGLRSWPLPMISSCPNSYQTLVDDDLLSGGQK